ncbi:Hypothetical_protein [Hexamita inflata]|uniref:Hypothetical_protein n=1 Tax=Hexamita inflata TaxID=28002 RepID=A0AA86NBT7_9EUKA|nr:Hypothetical protein HINF_LOCUS4402 [Hexamita inflata]
MNDDQYNTLSETQFSQMIQCADQVMTLKIFRQNLEQPYMNHQQCFIYCMKCILQVTEEEDEQLARESTWLLVRLSFKNNLFSHLFQLGAIFYRLVVTHLSNSEIIYNTLLALSNTMFAQGELVKQKEDMIHFRKSVQQFCSSFSLKQLVISLSGLSDNHLLSFLQFYVTLGQNGMIFNDVEVYQHLLRQCDLKQVLRMQIQLCISTIKHSRRNDIGIDVNTIILNLTSRFARQAIDLFGNVKSVHVELLGLIQTELNNKEDINLIGPDITFEYLQFIVQKNIQNKIQNKQNLLIKVFMILKLISSLNLNISGFNDFALTQMKSSVPEIQKLSSEFVFNQINVEEIELNYELAQYICKIQVQCEKPDLDLLLICANFDSRIVEEFPQNIFDELTLSGFLQ